ncbi:hypothetical protein XI06_13710 [Bradyrhizobium sp. CCBAU 11434]|nr:hypothetical protein [Bradyrhizobium sp. CCBAU 11434]
MKRSHLSEQQIIGILKSHEAGVSVADLCRKHGVSDASINKWKAKFGGMEVLEAKRLKALLAAKAVAVARMVLDHASGYLHFERSQHGRTLQAVLSLRAV